MEFNGDGEKRYVSPRSLVLESLEIMTVGRIPLYRYLHMPQISTWVRSFVNHFLSGLQ